MDFPRAEDENPIPWEQVAPEDEVREWQHVNLRIRLPVRERSLEALLQGVWSAGGVVIAEGPRILEEQAPPAGPWPMIVPEDLLAPSLLQKAGEIRARQTRKFLTDTAQAIKEAHRFANQQSGEVLGHGPLLMTAVVLTMLTELGESLLRVLDEGWEVRPKHAPEEQDLPEAARGTPIAGNLRVLFQQLKAKLMKEEPPR